jgi:hypothetical protein
MIVGAAVPVGFPPAVRPAHELGATLLVSYQPQGVCQPQVLLVWLYGRPGGWRDRAVHNQVYSTGTNETYGTAFTSSRRAVH